MQHCIPVHTQSAGFAQYRAFELKADWQTLCTQASEKSHNFPGTVAHSPADGKPASRTRATKDNTFQLNKDIESARNQSRELETRLPSATLRDLWPTSGRERRPALFVASVLKFSSRCPGTSCVDRSSSPQRSRKGQAVCQSCHLYQYETMSARICKMKPVTVYLFELYTTRHKEITWMTRLAAKTLENSCLSVGEGGVSSRGCNFNPHLLARKFQPSGTHAPPATRRCVGGGGNIVRNRTQQRSAAP